MAREARQERLIPTPFKSYTMPSATSREVCMTYQLEPILHVIFLVLFLFVCMLVSLFFRLFFPGLSRFFLVDFYVLFLSKWAHY